MSMPLISSIELEFIDGKWCVRVVENGTEVIQDFDLEQHARSFAAGQRMRLKLPSAVGSNRAI